MPQPVFAVSTIFKIVVVPRSCLRPRFCRGRPVGGDKVCVTLVADVAMTGGSWGLCLEALAR